MLCVALSAARLSSRSSRRGCARGDRSTSASAADDAIAAVTDDFGRQAVARRTKDFSRFFVGFSTTQDADPPNIVDLFCQRDGDRPCYHGGADEDEPCRSRDSPQADMGPLGRRCSSPPSISSTCRRRQQKDLAALVLPSRQASSTCRDADGERFALVAGHETGTKCDSCNGRRPLAARA